MDFIPRPQFDEWFHITSALNIGPFAAAIQTLMQSSTSKNKLPNPKVSQQPFNFNIYLNSDQLLKNYREITTSNQ